MNVRNRCCLLVGLGLALTASSCSTNSTANASNADSGTDSGISDPAVATVVEQAKTERTALSDSLKGGEFASVDGDASAPVLYSDKENHPLAFTFDQFLDDAVSRWSTCLGLAVRCADTPDTADRCAANLPVCNEGQGGLCCPAACVTQYKDLRAAGNSVKDAIRGSYLEGSCVPSFSDMRNQALGGQP